MNLRNAVLNSSFIGFSATPILGDYLSRYDFKRSVDDGAILPLLKKEMII